MIRKHIIFYGDVQGVGFRWRAKYAAEINSVTGWVRNLSDGSVEAELQGNEPNIDKMIIDIERSRYIYISNMKVKSLEVDEGERSFRVRD